MSRNSLNVRLKLIYLFVNVYCSLCKSIYYESDASGLCVAELPKDGKEWQTICKNVTLSVIYIQCVLKRIEIIT